jgi:nitrite reductase (NO-forming)
MVGEPVNLTLINAGDLPHDLVIPDLGVHLAVAPGRQATTVREIDEAGSYQFLCSYPGHAAAGMTGLLTVNPNP